MDFFNDPEWLSKFAAMDSDERREVMNDWLAEVAEPFQSDSVEDALVRSMVAAMHAFLEGAFLITQAKESEQNPPNPYIMGIWMHSYMRICKDFQAIDGISGIKRSLKKNEDE